MKEIYRTYAEFLKLETFRADSDHYISIGVYRNYHNNYEFFYVNHKDKKQVEALRTFLKSGKQMLLTLGIYRNITGKRYLMNVEDQQYQY